METEISKKDGVYLQIKGDILKGVIKAGDVLKEGVLAQQYSISKTPVREALCILAFENLVQTLPRAGYIVKAISVKDVIETFQVRLLLEQEAASLAAKHITPAEISELEKLLDYSGLVLENGSAWNKKFHLIIAHACGNSRLERVIKQVYDEVERITLLDPMLIQGEASIEHFLIVKAMQEQDSESASAYMGKHIETVRERVLGRL
jgi:GntR family transcriptional regulator, rspAB operon transcriptional repressor